MPNPGRFAQQDRAWREMVLPPSVRARVAVEAGVSHYWHPFVGERGRIIGIDRFGASAPGKALFKHYGLTVDHVIKAVQAVIESN
jgi:transketolase